MTPRPERLLDELERNDVEGAERVARAIVAVHGVLPALVRHYLWMLQDDPAEFERRVADCTRASSAPAQLVEAE